MQCSWKELEQQKGQVCGASGRSLSSGMPQWSAMLTIKALERGLGGVGTRRTTVRRNLGLLCGRADECGLGFNLTPLAHPQKHLGAEAPWCWARVSAPAAVS